MTPVESVRQFNRFYANILGKMDQDIYSDKFSMTEARVLMEIHLRKGCTATDIRESLGIDRGYLSRMLQQFEDQDLVSKNRSPEDKREYFLSLTDTGNETLTNLVQTANREVKKFLQPLPDPDRARLVQAMETIEAILSGKNKQNLKITIRPFQPGDVGWVTYLHGTMYSETYGFGKVFEYYVVQGLADFMKNPASGNLWIAEVNGNKTGAIAITKYDATTAQLRWFIIDEHYQGLSIGKKLMDTALAFCKQQGYTHVFLWTADNLKAARHLYKKYNFRLTGEKPNETWTGERLMEERWDLRLSDYQ
ncbi:MAG TPA: helix-turn-helix domain-containing GNAT family N-acetyltransferase [Bacillales bacterium]|nr:helix-turn-helix domain-containing GNAT family N-acetyltransferase [Bacillales bacterium]